MITSRGVPVGILCLLIGWAAGVARAEPGPQVVAPPAIALQREQSIDVAISGRDLGLIASAPLANPAGVSVAIVPADKRENNAIHLKVTASADAELGDREFRLVGPAGVSRPLRLFVSQYPVVAEKEPNNQPDEAQEISLPATIVGKIDAPGDVDQFRFSAHKGQQLIFDVEAARIGSPLDAVATLHSSDGREMRPILEHRGGDPVLIFQVPEDGDYRLRLRDLEYRGDGDHAYRIIAGQIPYVETILPSSGEPGQKVSARAIGYNLDAAEKIDIDLTRSAPGRIEVRAKTPEGFSNPVPFEVTELPQSIEAEPNDTAKTANAITLPTEVSGHVDRPGDEDYFKFHLAYKQVVNLEVLAGRYGSPVTPLLRLRNTRGDVMESNDGTPDADARIVRELDAGDYIASVRDLTFAGGPGYWYRLKIEPATRVPQDFSVRFLPDAPRLHRGGNVAMWCEVKRFNGFKGDVTLTPEGLPSGVSASPIVIAPDTSGWFTISAAPDAAVGSGPLRIRASATIGAAPVNHYAEAEIKGRVVQQAYLTVLEPAPFSVEAIAAMTPQRLEQLNAEIGALAQKLNAPDPKFDAALAEWESKQTDRPVWTALDPATASSSKSTPLVRQPDGSFMASGNAPAQDEYTVTAHTDMKGITAVRLEVMADSSLPNHGPGVAPDGNFVLTEFKLLANKEGQSPQPIGLKNATADFAQANFPIAAAIDNDPSTGWAVMPEFGRTHTAIFQTAMPIGFDEGTTLTFVLEQQSKFAEHNIGRFRLSVTTADPARLNNEAGFPREIRSILEISSADRTPEQTRKLASYFRTIDPQTAGERNRLAALQSFAEPYAEMNRLQNLLKVETPELKKEQQEWERSMAAGAGWTVLRTTSANSEGGAFLENERDGSVYANGINPSNDAYELSASTPLKGITAILLEALPDPRLPGNGPGRAADGNFILTKFAVFAGPKAVEIPFESARATFEQEKYPVASTIDDKHDTGWAISPEVGRPVEAIFYPKKPMPGGLLKIRIESNAKLPQYNLGRFRLWVTTNPQPDAAIRLPEHITQMLRSKGRTKEQQAELAAYFRTIAPSLEPVRRRLADLQGEVPGIPLKVLKNRNGAIPVPINRINGFDGEINVSLIGFANGREGDEPAPISQDLKLNPLSIAPGKLFGMLTFAAEKREQTGSRMVVLKAEAKVGNETITEYSPAFLLTIE